MTSSIGALTTGVLASVDERGTVTRDDVSVSWRVRVEDRWLHATRETSVRHERPTAAPATQTSMRVPGGDAIHRVYALADDEGVVVIEVENASHDAIAVAFAVNGAQWDDVLAVPRRPGAIEPDGAIVFPVPHRVTVRVALGSRALDVHTLADWNAAQRAWERVLERGMRTELPEPLQTQVDAARADALLAPRSGETFATLEAWGFDAEAITMWSHLRWRERRTARRSRATGILGDVRDALVRDRDREVEIVPAFRPEWLGQSIAAHDVPLKRGKLSFAIRWHGSRPALLWDAPEDCVLHAPTLDPNWWTADDVGETLLAEPSPALLSFHAKP